MPIATCASMHEALSPSFVHDQLNSGMPHLLKDRALVADVDAWQDAGAARQARHHVGHEVAVQVRRHLLSTTPCNRKSAIPHARSAEPHYWNENRHAAPDQC